jgi:cytochrome b
VLVMLALLLIQAVTGLFANDDVMNEGPLAHLAGKSRSDWLSTIHSKNFTLIEIAVVLHVVAVLTYAVLKRHDLVRPMVTGWKRLPSTVGMPRMASLWLAIPVLAVAVAVVVVLVNFA